MNDQNNQILCDRFPEHCDLIRQLSSTSIDFKELIQDYSDTIKAISCWQASNDSEALDRVKEYQNLKHELELEIKDILRGKLH